MIEVTEEEIKEVICLEFLFQDRKLSYHGLSTPTDSEIKVSYNQWVFSV